MFGPSDDRLLMPDGVRVGRNGGHLTHYFHSFNIPTFQGYVRLSELQKFYENNTLVRGDPSQVAKLGRK
jgi:hypothetical protein